MSITYTWHKIAMTIADIPFSAEGLAEIDVQGKKICIARYNESIFACAATCPHAGGTFAEGYIDTLGNITCPIHSYKFSLQNGRNLSGEGYFLKTFPIEKKEDGIYVGLPPTGSLID